MIKVKVDIKAYQKAGNLKKKSIFSIEEILLTHYETISKDAKKKAKNYFRDNLYSVNDNDELIVEEAIQQYLFEIKADVPFLGPEVGEEKFTFIDLFAGIGGFRMAMQNLGGKCIFSSEWDKYSQQTYRANFGEVPFGDITLDETKSYIPKKFDLLCGGFPCQPFSIAGVSKKIVLEESMDSTILNKGIYFFMLLK